jgi:signal transduction histidine kinase
LAIYLRQTREGVLSEWRERVARDPELTTAVVISRAQFIDSMPWVLDALEHSLQSDDGLLQARGAVEQRRSAAEHGTDRWQQGYDLRETIREWVHLQGCVLGVFERYAREHPGLEPEVMRRALETLVAFFGGSICESASRYTRLQQKEAASRVRELEEAAQTLRALDQQRAQLLRGAAHDLRGSVGVITNASAALARKEQDEETRAQLHRMLDRGLSASRALLTDLLDLGRLEAGQETLQLSQFDVAELLRELCDATRPLATERNLFLKGEGPGVLQVEGDAVKIRRIAQNLLLNGVKATQTGGVQVFWRESETEPEKRWVLRVEDTGPGFGSVDGGNAHTARTVTETNEGIGLSIVKRLCVLLDASLELQTRPAGGTAFRVGFPRQYPKPKS